MTDIIDKIIEEFYEIDKKNFGFKVGSADQTRSSIIDPTSIKGDGTVGNTDYIKKDDFKQIITETMQKDGFYILQCYQIYLDCSSTEENRKNLEKFKPIEEQSIQAHCNACNKYSKYWELGVEIKKITDDCGWQFLELWYYKLTDEAKELIKDYLNNQGDDTMVKLNEEAIDELMTLLNKVKGVQKLLKKWGIYIDSDCWNATSFDRDKEDILRWEKEDFEELELNGSGDIFFIGGNIVTGSQHEYNNKWILAPKKLAEVQGEIFTDYLMDIMDSVSLKHFELKFDDEFGLIDNCGWEHHICIDAIVKKSALTENKTKKLIQQIRNEEDIILELSASPLYENPTNNFSKNSELVPQGEFAYMLEFFSDLIGYDEETYQGTFGLNSKYIKDAMKLITKVENRAKEIAEKYADKGVKVTVNGMNDGCEYGMAVYVWIPYQ